MHVNTRNLTAKGNLQSKGNWFLLNTFFPYSLYNNLFPSLGIFVGRRLGDFLWNERGWIKYEILEIVESCEGCDILVINLVGHNLICSKLLAFVLLWLVCKTWIQAPVVCFRTGGLPCDVFTFLWLSNGVTGWGNQQNLHMWEYNDILINQLCYVVTSFKLSFFF